MDLLLIANAPPYPLRNPTRAWLYYLVRELSHYHHMIDLLCFYDEPEDYAQIPRYERYFRHIRLIRKPKLTADHLKKRLKDPKKQYPATAEAAWSSEMWTAIRERLDQRNVRYDVVQFIGGLGIYEYQPLTKKFPTLCVLPALLSEQLASQQGGTNQRRSPKPLSELHKLAADYESWIFDPFQQVVVMTQHEHKSLQARAPKARLSQLPPGVDADYFVPLEQSASAPNILFAGDFGHPSVLAAALTLGRLIFPTIKQAIPEAKLYLAGVNTSSVLRALASDAIQILGAVPDLRPYLALSMAFVAPLQQYAGHQPAILQAFASGTPVIATPYALEGIEARHNHDVLIARSHEELIKGTLYLLNERASRERLRKNALSLIHNVYAWDKVAGRYDLLYRQLSGKLTGF